MRVNVEMLKIKLREARGRKPKFKRHRVVYTNSIEYVEAFHEALKEELKNRYGIVYEQTNT